MVDDSDEEGVSARFEAVLSALEEAGAYAFVYYGDSNAIEFSARTCARYGVPARIENAAKNASMLISEEERIACLGLREGIDRGENVSSIILGREGFAYWAKVTLSVLSRNARGGVRYALGIIEDLSVAGKGSAKSGIVDGLRVPRKQNILADNARVASDGGDGNLLVKALSSIYFCTFYVDVANREFASIKLTSDARRIVEVDEPIRDTKRDFVSTLVHPDQRAEMVDFINLDTLPSRLRNESHIDCMYLSLTDKGWCRARWLPVRRDACGNVTHALFVIASIDSAKQKEIREERIRSRMMNLHYQAVESVLGSQVVGVCLVDKNTGRIDGWRSSAVYSDAEPIEAALMFEADMARMSPEAGEKFRRECSSARIAYEVGKRGKYVVSAELFADDGSTRTQEYHFAEYSADPDKIILVVEDTTRHKQSSVRFDDLLDVSPAITLLANSVPNAFALIRVEGDHFSVERANERYVRDFASNMGLEVAQLAARIRLSADDYVLYAAALRRCACSREDERIEIEWNETAEGGRRYKVFLAHCADKDGVALVSALFAPLG